MYKQTRGLIIRTKPFNHPAVISILRELFFGSTRKSLAEQHPNCFTSTLETRGNEPEIPAAALALVVTCVRFLYILNYYLILLLFVSDSFGYRRLLIWCMQKD
jgi:uncharacterized protein DUF6532